MNVKERDEWIKAVGACVPEANVKPMLAAAAALDAAGTGRWEVSVRGGGLTTAGLRFFGAGPYAPWRAACPKALGAGKGAGAPRAGRPWLSAAWDLKTGALTAARFGDEASARAIAFKEGFFKEPVLDAALGDFSRLAPVSAMIVDDKGWSLTLEKRLRWPLFARCDVSAAFTPASSQLALLMLDRSVAEIAFDGEALWAHCAG